MVDEVEPDKPHRAALGRQRAPRSSRAYKTRIEMSFEPLDDGGTFVTIAESGWREDEAGLQVVLRQLRGLGADAVCMKAYVEYGINLREGFYPSEMRGELPTSSDREQSGPPPASVRSAGLPAAPRQHVEPFDQRREAHGGVDVALRHMEADAVGDQRHADHQQEAQRQHDDGRVLGDEVGERRRRPASSPTPRR